MRRSGEIKIHPDVWWRPIGPILPGGTNIERAVLCRCRCGAERVKRLRDLREGRGAKCYTCHNRSPKNFHRVHGEASEPKHRGTPLYERWKGMKSRCLWKDGPQYEHYGGRGIQVCDEWVNDYQAFAAWARAAGYRPGLSLERIDVNGNYCPENCKWIEWRLQSRNRRDTLYLEINGERRPLWEWAELTGVPAKTIRSRVDLGISGEQLLSADKLERRVWSKLGIKGVSPCGNGKFTARVTVDGQTRVLGRFDSYQEAHVAYLVAKGHAARLKRREASQ